MNSRSNISYEFGPFRLDAAERQLWRDREEITLTPKAYAVLSLLVKHYGHTLTKDDFMREVWPDTVVEEKNLADNISTLRQALGDDPKESRYIKTIPRRGYRFVADVHEIREEGEDLVMHERSRARIVIDEEHGHQLSEVSHPADQTLRERPLERTLLSEKKGRRRTHPAFIVAACLLLGVLAFTAYRLWNGKTTPNSGQAQPVGVASARTMAVLPFKPLVAESRDPALELGMTDALITKLSNIRQITVRPTSSVMKYTAEGQDLRVAGSELGVDVLLDGKVQRVGDRVRLSVQLVRASDGAPVWAEKFDEKFTDIFTVQDAISEKVAVALSLKLTGEEKVGLAKRYTDNVEAYQLYLKGRQHWSTFTRAGLLTSINYYNEALKIDPNYALAYTGIANAYHVIGVYGPLTAKEAMPKAREAAEKALALDDNLSQAHTALGGNKILYERDWPGAERELKRAMELSPNSADPYDLYGYYLQAMGRIDEALTAFKRSAELAPQWFIPSGDLLSCYFEARRYDEAIERSRESIRLEPDNSYSNLVLGMALTEKGQYAEAVAALESAIAVSGDNDRPKVLSQLGYTYAVAGRKEEAHKIIEQLREKPNAWLPIHVAKIYAALGDKEQAFHWLERAADERFAFLYDIRYLPQFDSLRSDPRYVELLRRINLSP